MVRIIAGPKEMFEITSTMTYGDLLQAAAYRFEIEGTTDGLYLSKTNAPAALETHDIISVDALYAAEFQLLLRDRNQPSRLPQEYGITTLAGRHYDVRGHASWSMGDQFAAVVATATGFAADRIQYSINGECMRDEEQLGAHRAEAIHVRELPASRDQAVSYVPDRETGGSIVTKQVRVESKDTWAQFRAACVRAFPRVPKQQLVIGGVNDTNNPTDNALLGLAVCIAAPVMMSRARCLVHQCFDVPRPLPPTADSDAYWNSIFSLEVPLDTERDMKVSIRCITRDSCLLTRGGHYARRCSWGDKIKFAVDLVHFSTRKLWSTESVTREVEWEHSDCPSNTVNVGCGRGAWTCGSCPTVAVEKCDTRGCPYYRLAGQLCDDCGGKWPCSSCTLQNEGTEHHCVACGAGRT